MLKRTKANQKQKPTSLSLRFNWLTITQPTSLVRRGWLAIAKSLGGKHLFPSIILLPYLSDPLGNNFQQPIVPTSQKGMQASKNSSPAHLSTSIFRMLSSNSISEKKLVPIFSKLSKKDSNENNSLSSSKFSSTTVKSRIEWRVASQRRAYWVRSRCFHRRALDRA